MNSIDALMPLYKIIVSNGNTDERLAQVFWLSVAILISANSLLQLMKRQIDDLVAIDEQLQELLTWSSQKSRTLNVPYKPVVVRAFYLDLALTHMLELVGGTFDLARALDVDLTCNLAHPLALDLSLDRALSLNRVLDRVVNPSHVVDCVLERAMTHARVFEPNLEQSLQQLKEQLSCIPQSRENFMAWWQSQGQAWTEQLRALIVEYRHCGYDWQYNEQQKEILLQYYDANQLLVACLNNVTCVANSTQNEIEATLLLPIAEIEAI
ncbi:MAG: hypothetical protein JOZ78_00685 [Chroococcidiopsidaceae cyanobacterium CP_BM_ER_R8_30]|nr:hypothetical protein [Chroococcidiopsidaceae cyanobacterium CP_BM_ER_R8_30]